MGTADLGASHMGGLIGASIPFSVACGSSMIATICIQPIDTVKVRMQLLDKGRGTGAVSVSTVVKDLVARGGVINLYQGLSAGLLRQLVYGTLRLGLFSTFEQQLSRRAREQGTTLGFRGRALAGLGAGAIAAFVGNPTEVALIRMQADGMKPVEQQRNYSSAFNAIWRIAREEGVLGLWKGAAPTIFRAMSTNFGQLAFFSESKHQIQQHTDMSHPARIACAAAIAGFAGAFISLPFDFVKTRLQNQTATGGRANELPNYSGTFDCLAKVIRREGVIRFYRDFWPYFFRIAPHSVVALFLADQANELILKKKWLQTYNKDMKAA